MERYPLPDRLARLLWAVLLGGVLVALGQFVVTGQAGLAVSLLGLTFVVVGGFLLFLGYDDWQHGERRGE